MTLEELVRKEDDLIGQLGNAIDTTAFTRLEKYFLERWARCAGFMQLAHFGTTADVEKLLNGAVVELTKFQEPLTLSPDAMDQFNKNHPVTAGK
jgi:hypothetical protein